MKNLLPVQIAAVIAVLVTAALLIPMPKWQGLIGRFMKKSARLVLAAVFAAITIALCALLYMSSDVTISSDGASGTYPILHAAPTAIPTPEPTSEPSPEPTPDVNEPRDYVLNTSRMKFHYPDCDSVSGMAEHNKSCVTLTRQEVIDMGYGPCGRCTP